MLDAIEEIALRITLGDKELSASQVAEMLGFSPARQRTPVADLSGGERRRLQLTRVLMAEPNVLILDEPTNDLDIETLQQVEELLDGWAGTLVVVSHDRYLIERVCDSTWALFGDGKLTNLPGGIEEYLGRHARIVAGPSKAAPGGGRDGSAQRAAQKELGRLERAVAKFGDRAAVLHGQLAEYATDPDRVVTLTAELNAVIADKDAAEVQWMELAESLE